MKSKSNTSGIAPIVKSPQTPELEFSRSGNIQYLLSPLMGTSIHVGSAYFTSLCSRFYPHFTVQEVESQGQKGSLMVDKMDV